MELDLNFGTKFFGDRGVNETSQQVLCNRLGMKKKKHKKSVAGYDKHADKHVLFINIFSTCNR